MEIESGLFKKRSRIWKEGNFDALDKSRKKFESISY